MTEKRRIKRVRKRLQLRFGIDGFSTLGFTEDISAEGLFIRSTVVYPPGTLLQVQIVSSETPIELQGRIKWARKVPQNLMNRIRGGMGIRIEAFQSGEELYRTWLAG